MPRKREERPYEQIVHHWKQAQAEMLQVAEDLVQTMHEQLSNPMEERTETVHAALSRCLEILRDQDRLRPSSI